MSIFYFDQKLKEYEDNFNWDQALIYLEDVYKKTRNIKVINSLIGFSWYYFIEGGVESQKYSKDCCERGLMTWKKYIDIGIQEYYNDPSFNFICGYTLFLHGFFINVEYEKMGMMFMKNCLKLSNGTIKLLANYFLKNTSKRKYVVLENNVEICEDLFDGNSLLERYFFEIYSPEKCEKVNRKI